jgi:hypothetical protein
MKALIFLNAPLPRVIQGVWQSAMDELAAATVAVDKVLVF